MLKSLPAIFAAVAASFTLVGCATLDHSAPLPGGQHVALGQKAYVDGPIVQPLEVLEDSRCPTDVYCIRAGQVRVKMAWLRPTGERHIFEVTLGQATPLADGAFRLQSVSPEKLQGKEIKPGDYRFAFRFDGGL